jgi:MerR family copper efflux transcriptional regulator
MEALTIHEAAASTGWSARMLRYIERAGLLELPRSAAGYRLYGPPQLQRLRTLRTLLEEQRIALAEVGFAARLRREPALAAKIEHWLDSEATRPGHVAPDDWLRWEQDKHEALIRAASPTRTLEIA